MDWVECITVSLMCCLLLLIGLVVGYHSHRPEIENCFPVGDNHMFCEIKRVPTIQV